MNFTLFNFTAVILGQAHNPSILNPDFLAARHIVPKKWGWKVAETITTPPLALVRYENGVSVQVEPHKMQVGDPNIEAGPTNSKATEVAAAYVTTLPHVCYTAVGMNFQGYVEMSTPDAHLKKRFLRNGAWDGERHALHAAGLRLVYMLPTDCRITLSIDAGEVKPKGADEEKQAIVVNGNFHRECTGEQRHEDVKKHLEQVASDWETFQSLVRDALETKE